MKLDLLEAPEEEEEEGDEERGEGEGVGNDASCDPGGDELF